MGQVHERIDGRLREFVAAQAMFFVGTAPAGAEGHVNVSPKGMLGTFRVVDEHTVAYLDYYGSGAETIAHLRENGRVTVMFCAFQGPPNIVRLYGHGRFTAVSDDACAALVQAFPAPPDLHAVRGVVTVDVTRISTTCGFSVPLMAFDGDRDLLVRAHSRRDEAAFTAYRATKNARSIDGLPALDG